MSTEIATRIPRREALRRAARQSWRTVAVQLIGPLTILAGIAWAVAQPYRIVLLDREGQGLYDYLFQPPLLVVCVGLVYAVVIAPGLVADMEQAERDPEA